MSKPSHNLGEKLLEGEERAKEEWAHYKRKQHLLPPQHPIVQLKSGRSGSLAHSKSRAYEDHQVGYEEDATIEERERMRSE